MAALYREWRITAAALCAVGFIVGAYFLATNAANPPVAQASEESALLQAIATRDSTGDGLPDWEKALYGIPLNATTTDYFHLGMTDGEAVAKGLIVPKAIVNVPTSTSSPSIAQNNMVDGVAPPSDNSLTYAFAKSFFMLYVNAKQANGGADLSQAQIQAVANQALTELSASVTAAPPFKSAGDLYASGSGAAAMQAFAADAEKVLASGTANATTSEVNYLKAVIVDGNAAALTPIASIAKSYRVAATGIAALPVPQELVAPDLALVNALAHLGEIIQDFTAVNTDPMTTMLALQQYPQAVLDLGNALIAFHSAFVTAGITLLAGTPGAAFVNAIPDIAAEQATSTP